MRMIVRRNGLAGFPQVYLIDPDRNIIEVNGALSLPGAMPTLRNPILPGFNPDPSILRVGDDYYIATSTFEWYPGRPDPSLAAISRTGTSSPGR